MEKNDFAIADVAPGKLNALVKKIMQQTGATDPNEAVRLVNSGSWIVSKFIRIWRSEEGIIYFSVTSDGTTGKQWITRLDQKGFNLSVPANNMLRSDDFKPTSGVTTKIAVFRGVMFDHNDRYSEYIRAEADCRNWMKPNAEVACLIREALTDEEIAAMGLMSIVTMHEPIKDSCGHLNLLVADRDHDGNQFDACDAAPDGKWRSSRGFAFAAASLVGGLVL